MAILPFIAPTRFLLGSKLLCRVSLIIRPRVLSRTTLLTQRPPPSRNICTAITEVFSDDDSSNITQCDITEEIRFYRHCGNQFTQTSFSDPREPYGPPLAIILPWKGFTEEMLKSFLEFYGEKGFDILTVCLKHNQMMFPCHVGNAMSVVSDLLKYLNEKHSHRPYFFHGFSIGAYVFGEMMAQFSDQYEKYRELSCNVKGCVWDSPVDFITVQSQVGKFVQPKNFFKRWKYNRGVRRHFKKHHHDSVVYWLRSRENFCNPIRKVPYLFLVSYTDPLSNPCSLQCAQKTMEGNGIPIFQKAWWDSPHGLHFEKYCYEYLHSMTLFFNQAKLYPDEEGKYRSNPAATSLTNFRLSKKAREDKNP